jgi:hypothetical protein
MPMVINCVTFVNSLLSSVPLPFAFSMALGLSSWLLASFNAYVGKTHVALPESAHASSRITPASPRRARACLKSGLRGNIGPLGT